ncbi:hypothetical protein [Corynebacterium sp. ES2715-CONJ3]|uniref:hypothetical protein n=1 Tax=Corynebacterium sp. ES2715-CONJ3 TaxID=2974028 RepID=UPI002168BA2B|nr:hypothetical protein [Corynebacterium sp. ES2715-CONJ3]MCS4491145.1 hypothetical protein [Corynebacterium sp. ES2715-CONJ3]
MTGTFIEYFDKKVENFIADLRTFSTGSYLRASEKEFWDPPYDSEQLAELENLLYALVRECARIDDPSLVESDEFIVDTTSNWHRRILEFNYRNADAIIEPEEAAELEDLIAELWALKGVAEARVTELPRLTEAEYCSHTDTVSYRDASLLG